MRSGLTTSILHLPQEMIDMIIDFLHDDVQSLQACALISRSWLPSSRSHLFSSRTIKEPADFQALSLRVTELNTSRDMGSYIRQLTITGEGTRGRAGGLTFETFKTLFGGLPRLRRLTIHNLAFNNTDYWGRHAIPIGPLQDAQPKPGPFALEELQLLEEKMPDADYSHLFGILALFSSIKTLFLASEWRDSKDQDSSYKDHPHWNIASAPGAAPVRVQRLHTFNMPPSVTQALLEKSIAIDSLQTIWYDDEALDWTSVGNAHEDLEVHQLGRMIVSLPSLQHSLHTLILGPLPIFENAREMQRGLASLQLGSARGVRTFHLRGRWVEPHLAAVFAALPDTIREVRFVVVGPGRCSPQGSEGSRNRFRAFGEAFAPVLRERVGMTFVLDLGVLRGKFPQSFAMLKERVEKGFMGLSLLGEGRVRIDDSPKEAEHVGCCLATIGDSLGTVRVAHARTGF